MITGEQLKRIREMRGISQAMLANYLGITNRSIIYIEKMEHQISEELYERWIKALYSDDIYQASKRKVNSLSDLKTNKKILEQKKKENKSK